MKRNLLTSRIDLLHANLPGSLRVSLFCYEAGEKVRQYRPIPNRHCRISADTPEQEQALWDAVVAAIKTEVNTWPPTGEGIDIGWGIETEGLNVGGDDDV